MKLRSLLPTCSSSVANSGNSPAPPTPPKSVVPDRDSSIQTNLSIITLPSVPSLQRHLTLSPLNDAVKPSTTAVFLSSLNHPSSTAAHTNFLAVQEDLLYAATGDIITVYSTKTLTILDTLTARTPSAGAAKSIAFRGGKIFTAHQDGKIRVWTSSNHKLITTLPTLEDRLRKLVFPQNYVKIRRHSKKLWVQHYDVVSGLSSFENHVFSMSWDKSVKIWRARDSRCVESINGAHDDAINCVAVGEDVLVYTGSADTRIKAWKMEGGRYGLIATLEKHKSAVNALALSVDGSVLFSGSCDRSILVWEKEDCGISHMAVTGALRGHAKAVLCLISVRDLLMSGSGDRTVRIWRRGFADGRYSCLAVLEGHKTPVRAVAAAEVEEDGEEVKAKVFSGSFDGEIRAWRIEVTTD